MSEYPGEPPRPESESPEAEQAREQVQQGDPSEGVEPTAPITPTPPGPVFNPTTAMPSPSWSDPGQAAAQGPVPQAPPPAGYGAAYPPPPYDPTGHGGQYGASYGGQYGAPQQAPYGAPPGYGQYGAFTPAPPNHPQATTSMVLGIVGLVGILLVCGLTLFLSPFAWALGHNALKEIQAAQGRLGGESRARAGMITGIIGTVLLVLAIVGVLLLVVLVAASPDSGYSSGTDT